MHQAAPRPRAFHAVVNRIRDDIFQGRLTPGDRLPREQGLADQFGVSRPAVREALRVLELQGLVRVQYGYGGGAFVAQPDSLPVLGALQTSLRFGQASVDELYQARVLFEPIIARLAVESAPGRLADELARNIARTEALLASGDKAFGANLEFHALLAHAAGNRVLGLVMQALLELLDHLDQDYPTNPTISEAALDDHRQILQAARSGLASRVETLMVGHLLRLESRFSEIQERLGREPRSMLLPSAASCGE